MKPNVGWVKTMKRSANRLVALLHYRQAMSMDANHALNLQRKVIDLQLQQNDVARRRGITADLSPVIQILQMVSAPGLCVIRRKLLVDQSEYREGPGAAG